jgi:F-type H+-transporting ATPase subunit b
MLFAALIVSAVAIAAPPRAAHFAPVTTAFAQAAQPDTQAAQAGTEPAGGEWMPVFAKAFNFVVLVGVLVYFLKTPLSTYLTGRISRVRQDLVTAAETREMASRQLAEIAAKLKAIPAEIELLKRRGAEDLAAERVRIQQAAAAERQRLLEHTAREIEMKFRVAKRALIEHAADLAVQVAAQRIGRSITAEDHARLFDRYAGQLQTAPGPAGSAQP